MNRPIWDKGGESVDEALQAFLAGEDVLWDRHLFLHDVRASAAHARGLQRIGVLTLEESNAIGEALDELALAFRSGAFVLDARFEDCHSAIEAFLTEKLGDAGRKVHTGRSRNDQVLTALRLYVREQLEALQSVCAQVARAALVRARTDGGVPMPGYTHLQRAVPSSVGLWMAASVEAFTDVALLARQTRTWMDACPLGTAAGYGVNLPLDREGVAAELGFARVLWNPMYAQNSRGTAELVALGVASQALLHARRLAWDLSLFTTAEYAFVSLPARYTTGSSIMPNKRNPDGVELLRAAHAVVTGATAEIQDVLSLPSGYQRDLQATKGPVIRAFMHTLTALRLIPAMLREMTFNTAAMRAAISPDTYATDRAVELTAQGVPFRDAYKRTAAELDTLSGRKVEDSLNARTSPGATADLRLDALEARLVTAEG